jgi:hypothetical protein
MPLTHLSPITAFLRDLVVSTIIFANQRMRWVVCGSGRSGVTTLQSAFQSNSDIMPDTPPTAEKVTARIIRGRAGSERFRFRAADMMNQPPGRWQYLEEIVARPVGLVYVFKTYRQDGNGAVMDEHLQDKSEFFRTPEGHLRHEADYQQFRFLTNAFLYPETLEQNYPDVFAEANLNTDIRHRYLHKYSGHAPRVMVMAGNFIDLTFPMQDVRSTTQWDYAMRQFLLPYMEIFRPLTDQWQRYHRKNWVGGAKPPVAVKYVGISAKYNLGVHQLLSLMRNSVGIWGN